MQSTMTRITLFQLLSILLLTYSCQPKLEKPITNHIIIDGISVPEGFVIEKLYDPSENDQGSWVSITKDDEGNFYTSDQSGNLYKVKPSEEENVTKTVIVEKLDLNIGLAQGLLWHEGNLYAVVNSFPDHEMGLKSGLYKISDTDQDGAFDQSRLLRALKGYGEHGPHSIELSPDKQSLYIVMGDHTDIPDDIGSVVPKVWQNDNLLPIVRDPSGHARTRQAPGGWVVKTDLEGKTWTIVNASLRNTFDIAFNEDEELFCFDSDMEYDMGMPWYRPIRLCHLTSGGEFGWRAGSGKFPDTYPDNLPAVSNMGQGSPTGVMNGKGLKFPSYYQKGLYLYDWSYGTMYHAKLIPEGSTYTAEVTEFLSGVPLPLTNGIVGDDGAMYFITGGRELGSGLYRLKYIGDEPAQIQNLKEHTQEKESRDLRKEIETYHSIKSPDKIGFIAKHLDHHDRFIRYAARIAMEHQDYNLWKDEINKKGTPLKTINLALSIARHGNDEDRLKALISLLKIEWAILNQARQIDYARAINLLLIRMEDECPPTIKKDIIRKLFPVYLSSVEGVNKEICQTLSYLQVSEIIAPTLKKMETDTIISDQKSLYLSGDVTKRSEQYGKSVEKMLKNMPNQEHVSYAKSLAYLNTGWTNETRERYFGWFKNAKKKTGGVAYGGFMKAIQKQALTNVPKTERAYFEKLTIEEEKTNKEEAIRQPEGPGQEWTVDNLVSAYEKNKSQLNFENGRNFFSASVCIACHSVKGNGGSSGPELTQVGTRFSIADLGKAIIDPSATIPDRFGSTELHLKGGKILTGRIMIEGDTELQVNTNSLDPNQTIKVKKEDILKRIKASHSPMPPGLINRLNEQELSDLLGFLVSGGDKSNKLYETE